jgi:hypothetical protein
MDSTLNHHISSSAQWFEMERGLLEKALTVDTPNEHMLLFPYSTTPRHYFIFFVVVGTEINLGFIFDYQMAFTLNINRTPFLALAK